MSTTTRSSFQEGSIQRVKRAYGPDAWVYRWRETQADGIRVHRKQLIGDVTRFKTKSEPKKPWRTCVRGSTRTQDCNASR